MLPLPEHAVSVMLVPDAYVGPSGEVVIAPSPVVEVIKV